ncbi:hypothetical protein BX616_007800 [Lobosporangium transversale]|uniref:Uncharacterized protein n=1 Tax=Lobosporangium transversale TaxID=64571 RepID=A0A1Y2GN58_9FUNG|nr:hypothetical protein BCR41DRAFT_353587 [Lobosporangium transversale]KAF9914672.1 hypothetical protein BX616_007800 [Lobosporangium transversale]ORZ16138.1 hypothetical protein BCR41DRAFT_353587 [Lobosporangium transversale]|eukprot:XP_021881485.1 hypothetical protein BCR41DRAFT_353587 [Lobosporangium transversale]
MGLYSSCNFPWVDDVVQNFATNTTRYNQVSMNYCCTESGVCENYNGKCPFGYLGCTVGNSRYACRWDNYGQNYLTCYQEGVLKATRSLPCCPAQLPSFLSSTSCMPAFGTNGGGNTICCTSPGKCQYALGCIGYDSYNGHAGEKTGVYYGYQPSTSVAHCVQEMSLGSPVTDENCLEVTVPQGGCILGEAGPTLPTINPGSSTTATVTTKTTSRGSPTGNDGLTPPPTNTKSNAATGLVRPMEKDVKWIALCLLAPSLLQMLFI